MSQSQLQMCPARLPESLLDSQDRRYRRSSHTELEFFIKLPQQGGFEGDLNSLSLAWGKDALPGRKLEAVGHVCGWRDEGEGSIERSLVNQIHLQQQESEMEIHVESSLLVSYFLMKQLTSLENNSKLFQLFK